MSFPTELVSATLPTAPILLTPDEVATSLRMSRTMVFHLLRAQRLRSIKVGRLRRVPVEAVNDFIATRLTSTDEEE